MYQWCANRYWFMTREGESSLSAIRSKKCVYTPTNKSPLARTLVVKVSYYLLAIILIA